MIYIYTENCGVGLLRDHEITAAAVCMYVLIGGLLYGGFSWGFWGLRFISGHCRAIRSETQINKT